MKCSGVYTRHRHVVLYVPCGPRAYGVGAPVKGYNCIEHDDDGYSHLRVVLCGVVWCCTLLYVVVRCCTLLYVVVRCCTWGWGEKRGSVVYSCMSIRGVWHTILDAHTKARTTHT